MASQEGRLSNDNLRSETPSVSERQKQIETEKKEIFEKKLIKPEATVFAYLDSVKIYYNKALKSEMGAVIDFPSTPARESLPSLNLDECLDAVFDTKEFEAVLEKKYDQKTLRGLTDATKTATHILSLMTNIRLGILQNQSISEVDNNISEFMKVYEKTRLRTYEIQKLQSFYSEAINGYSIGHPSIVENPGDFLIKAFQEDTTLPQGFISKAETDSVEAQKLGDEAEDKVNREMSIHSLFLVAGPKWSVMDNVFKLDSIAFVPDSVIVTPPEVVEELISLSNYISKVSYLNSLINYNPEKVPVLNYENEAKQPEELKELNNTFYTQRMLLEDLKDLYHDEETKLTNLRRDVELLRGQIVKAREELASTKNKEREKSLKILIRELFSEIRILDNEILKLVDAVSLLQESQKRRRNEIRETAKELRFVKNQYYSSNPSLSIFLNPKDKISIYNEGSSLNSTSEEEESSEMSINEASKRLNELCIKYNISVKAIQTKRNANKEDIYFKIQEEYYTGAAGVTKSNDRSYPNTLGTCMGMFLNSGNINAIPPNEEVESRPRSGILNKAKWTIKPVLRKNPN
ncbi:MAG: hypothetical protein ACRCXZ_07410 [Patescibacteria group bacterium]